MSFDNAAWAINGALLGSSLARRAEFAALGGAAGVVQKDDLKVSQLDVPGIGVQIAPGVALVSNKYQAIPNETYVASNPSVHIIPSDSMPASNPSAKSYILAVVVGDPDFSQVGHPWMPSTGVPAGQENTFQYVRPTLIEVAAGATTLAGAYPALPLARIDVPANTTTITNAMIVDLRKLARPRQEQQIFVSPGGTWTDASPVRIPSGSAYGDFGSGQFLPTVTVPSWATRAIIVASINGVKVDDTSVNVAGHVRTQLGGVVGPDTIYDYSIGGGAIRDNLQTAGSYDVTSIAGQDVTIRVEGYQTAPASPTTSQRVSLRGGSQQIFDVRFFEQ